MARNILITGATGLVGSDLAARVLFDDPTAEVRAIVRDSERSDFEGRLDSALRFVLKGPDFAMQRGRVRAVRGDLTRPGLGLAESDYDFLAGWTDEIIHSAASTSFSLSMKEAWPINVEATRELIAFAHRVRARRPLRRFAHLSTAYVAGDRRGPVFERDLDRKQAFLNSYESTKFEAERLLARERGSLPVVVFRPCAIIGDSGSGRTPTFNVIYYPLRLLWKNMLPVLPGSPGILIDLVPVDFVGRAIVHILHDDRAIGKTFHLTAGRHVCTIGEIAELSIRFLNAINRERGRDVLPVVRFIPKWIYRFAMAPLLRLVTRDRTREAFRKLDAYLPYLEYVKRFDATETNRHLAGTGIDVPPLSDYFERTCRYAVESDWGRTEVPAR